MKQENDEKGEMDEDEEDGDNDNDSDSAVLDDEDERPFTSQECEDASRYPHSFFLSLSLFFFFLLNLSS